MARRGNPTDDKDRTTGRGSDRRRTIERVQTGVRMERRMLLVLKALAGAHDLTFGDLLEGIVLHAFEGKSPFGNDSLAKVAALREVYGLDLTLTDSHLLIEAKKPRRKRAET